MKALCLLLAISIPSHGAIAFVTQATNSGSNVTSLVVTIPSTGAANLLVASVGFTSSSISVSGITGCGTWALGKRTAASAGAAELWYAPNISAACTSVTISMSAKNTIRANVSEFSGLDTSTPLGETGGNNGTSATPSTGNLTTTANANDLLVANAEGSSTWAYSSGPTNSFNGLTTIGTIALVTAYRIVSATGTYSTGWTMDTSRDWNSSIIALECTSCGGASPDPKRLMLLGVGQ